MTIHERIFTLRRAAGLSQETLAERVGVSRQAIGKWENGAALPGLDNLQALAAALGVNCDELLTGEASRRGAMNPGTGTPPGGEPDNATAETDAPGKGNAHAVPTSAAARTDEDASAPPAGADAAAKTRDAEPTAAAPGDTEPTAAGLRALLEAYHTAQAQAARRQRMLLASLAAVLLALAGLGVFADARLNALAGRVDEVSGRMDGIDRRIDSRIDAIQTGIEQSLSETERIVADFDWQYRTLPEDRIELTLTATPKSSREDTAAAFSVVPSGGAAITAEAVPRADGGFTAQLEIPLTEEYESFAVMAAFTTDGETQSQMLFREAEFYSGRRITANLTLTDFRAAVLPPDAPNTKDERLSLGGECGLEIRRAGNEDAPVPVSAEVVLLVDGEQAAAQAVELNGAFGMPEPLPNGEAYVQESIALGGTWYVRFEPVEIPLPRTGAVLEATVTDSAGRTVVCRQEVYRP